MPNLSTDPLYQPLKKGGNQFPGIWQYLLPNEFQTLTLPEERCATCMSCPQVEEAGFRQDYRCCTYHPRVPNYALGLALATKMGQVGVQNAQALGMLTPEGMTHSPKQYIDYLYDLEEERFGKSERVLCPHLEAETGFCRIHAFRNGVCSTFFCLNDHGDKGQKFWGKVQTLVCQIEMALSQWCMRQVGFDVEDYIKRYESLRTSIKSVSRKDHGLSKDALKTLWGPWFGKELSFYERCGELVSEHRHLLWEIARSEPILEAKGFDRALLKMVPKTLASQVDEEEWEDGEPVSPDELWQECLKSYYKLWQLPLNPLRLARRAEFVEEEGKTFLCMRTRVGAKDNDFKVPLTPSEAEVLRSFKDPQAVTWDFFKTDQVKQLSNVKNWLAELFARRVLVKA